MDLLRHGATGRLFSDLRAPSRLGTFLRSFTCGHVRQLDSVAARLWPALARLTPLLPSAAELAYIDVDDTVRQTYGYAKQGAGRGDTGVAGLNALIGTVSTRQGAPLIVATRLRKGSTASPQGAARLVTDALSTAMAFNLTRAAGTLAGALHARATTGTIRAQLITVPARVARSARRIVLHLPRQWPWTDAWQQLFTASRHGPPAPVSL